MLTLENCDKLQGQKKGLFGISVFFISEFLTARYVLGV